MTEKIGLQAIFNDADFQRGLQRYLQGIARAQGETARTANQVSAATSAIGRAWQGVGGVMQSALGFIIGGVIVRGFEAVGQAAVRSAGDVFNAVASWERLGLVTQSLVARELSQGQETTILQQTRISLTEKEREKLEELRDTEQALVADIGAAQARLEEMMRPRVQGTGKTRTVTFEDPRIIAERQQNLAALNERLQETRAEIAALEAKEGALATVEKVVWTNQMSMADAMAQAGPKAKELLNWMERLAILSPFSTQDVADAFRLAMVYEFTTDEAQRLTKALVDMAAGTGIPGEVLERITMSLGQMHTLGKVSAREVRELAIAGVPIKSILAKSLNVTTKELEAMLEEGLVPVGDALERVVEWIEKSYGGAAERQAKTWAGLKESLVDLKNRVIREFFTPIMEPFRPLVVKFVDLLMSEDTRAKVRRAGERIGWVLKWALEGEWRMALYSLGVPQPVIDSLARYAGILENVWSKVQKGDWRGALQALSVPDWVIKTAQQGVDAFERIKKALGDIMAADLRKGLTELGLPESVVLALTNGATALNNIKSALVDIKDDRLGEALQHLGISKEAQDSLAAAARSITEIATSWAKFADKTLSEAMKLDWSFLRDVTAEVAGNLAEVARILGIVKVNTKESTHAASGLAVAFRDLVWTVSQIALYIQNWAVRHLGELAEAVASLTRADVRGFFEHTFGAIGNFFGLFTGLPGLIEQISSPPWNTTGRAHGDTGEYRPSWDPRSSMINEYGGVGNVPYGPQLPAGFFPQPADWPGWKEPWVAELWKKHAERQEKVGQENKALSTVPEPQGWALAWAQEVQRRQDSLKGEYQRLLGLPDIGTGGLRGSGKAWGVPQFATGLDRVFTQPTLFQGIVAEHGPERVHITPAGSTGFNGPLVGQLIINAPGGNPTAVRQAAEIGVVRGARRLGVGVR